jgi:thioredoxin 1
VTRLTKAILSTLAVGFVAGAAMILRDSEAGTVRDATAADFSAMVLAADAPVVVDFWAPWCPWCQRFAPEYSELAASHRDVRFVRINVDDAPELAQSLGVTSLPTVKFFCKGREQREAVVGAVPVERLAVHLRALERDRSCS